MLVLDYNAGFTTPLVEERGGLIAAEGRKWSVWNVPATQVLRLSRGTSVEPATQVVVGGAAADGAVNVLDATSAADNGNIIKAKYQTAYVQPGGTIQVGALEVDGRGNAQIDITQLADEATGTAKPPLAVTAQPKLYTVKTRGQNDMWAFRLTTRNPGDAWEISALAMWVHQVWSWNR